MFSYELLSGLLDSDLQPFPARLPESDASPRQVAVGRLRESFYKKLAPNGISVTADHAALLKFKKRLDLVGMGVPEGPLDSYLLGEFHLAMQLLFEDREGDSCDFARLSESLEPGPGNSRLMRPGNFFEKYFQGPLSASCPQNLAYYRAAVYQSSPCWAAAEMQRNLEFGTVIVKSSNLFFAKKNRDESRVCCTEGGVEMLFQKSIATFILSRLASWGIDLRNQADQNRELARIGSSCGMFSTVDLTSASDSICFQLIRDFVPMPLRAWLLQFRMPLIRFPDGSEMETPIVCTMGNGYTFALQTAIFSCVVRACTRLKDRSLSSKNKDWGVFGDDIVVRKDLMPSVSRLLSLLGFEVNLGKSFESGSFRESCGGDYFLGHQVRGVYLRSLETDPERFSAINRLNRWSAAWDIPLRQTVRSIYKACVRTFRVPRQESDDAGIHVPLELAGHNPVAYRATKPRAKSRVIKFLDGEYLGYSNALYTALLGGFVRSVDVKHNERPRVVDNFDSLSSTEEGSEHDSDVMPEVPGILVNTRVTGSSVVYAVRSLQVNWWDWVGLHGRTYSQSWEALVAINLSLD